MAFGSHYYLLILQKQWPKVVVKLKHRHYAKRGVRFKQKNWQLRQKMRKFTMVQSAALRTGDIVLVSAGDFIPSDGEVIEGIASVNESAITGESAPVIRESGGDRSAVTGGTQVISDWLIVRITSNPGGNIFRSHDFAG